MESHYICPLRYRLSLTLWLCIKKQWPPCRRSFPFSLSPATIPHFPFPRRLVLVWSPLFSDEHPVTFICKSPPEAQCTHRETAVRLIAPDRREFNSQFWSNRFVNEKNKLYLSIHWLLTVTKLFLALAEIFNFSVTW